MMTRPPMRQIKHKGDIMDALELARFVIESGRIDGETDGARSEQIEVEVAFEALERGATEEEARLLAGVARKWYER